MTPHGQKMTLRRYCNRCGKCYDTAPGYNEYCGSCAKLVEAERDRQYKQTIRREQDNRFAPKGQAKHKQVIIPGGLENRGDGYFSRMSFPRLSRLTPP